MNNMEYDYGVFIGRFQPFHNGHLHNISYGLLYAQKIIILIGSSFRAPTIKNPFSYMKRRNMILSDLHAASIDLHRIIIEPVSDWFYNEYGWRNEVEKMVNRHIELDNKVAIIGHQKDSSSYYLKCFPNWKHVAVTNFDKFNATDFRLKFFKERFVDEKFLVKNEDVHGSNKILKNYMLTEEYADLREEFEYILNYRQALKYSPFKPIFVTTNAMVLWQRRLLLIQRNKAPGKNLWALPESFLDYHERILDGILRALEEETNLIITSSEFSNTLVAQAVFDHPDRSLCGRTIAHLGLLTLKRNYLPITVPQDGVKAIQWVELDKVFNAMSHCLVDDHYQMIKFMSTKYI